MYDRGKHLGLNRLAKKRRKKKLLKASAAAFGVLLLIGAAAGLSHLQLLKITDTEVVGNVLISAVDIEEKILRGVEGDYLFVFSKSNSLLYPRARVKENLIREFPRIKEVDVELSTFKKLKVEIVEREPVALWCEESKGEEDANISAEACYFMDSAGYIFAEAPSYSGDVYFKYYGGLASSTEPIVGNQFMQADRFPEIAYFVRSLQTLSIGAEKFIREPDGDYKVVLKNRTSLLFSEKRTYAESLDNLNVLLHDSEIKSDSAFLDKVDYIDLRFGNKIYYKVR